MKPNERKFETVFQFHMKSLNDSNLANDRLKLNWARCSALDLYPRATKEFKCIYKLAHESFIIWYFQGMFDQNIIIGYERSIWAIHSVDKRLWLFKS